MIKVSRIGLLNFWDYDDEEFEFFDGKLLLRGKNGSGKSVTMQSFVPLILDANKNPKRLDTFGSSDKHIDYYLLLDERDDSTGYLYMEFFDDVTNNYITIGMGLNARRGKNVDFWGFAILDGKRVNKDLYLYKVKDGFSKTPLTKIEFKTMLNGTVNKFVDTQRDYKAMVNDLLFGFKSLVSYDEFINILLQIRSPKLSKEYRPTDLMQILNDVLPPLSQDDLMPISETIESLNSTKEKLNSLSSRIADLNNFIKVFNNYNEAILYGKAKRYSNVSDKLSELKEKMSVLRNQEKQRQEDKVKLDEAISKLDLEYNQALIEKEQIDNSDLKKKKERQFFLEGEISDRTEEIQKNSENLNLVVSKQKELELKVSECREEVKQISKAIEESVRDIENLSSRIFFDDLTKYLSLIVTGDFDDFSIVDEIVKSKQNNIERIKTVLEQKEELINKLNKLDKELDELNSEYDELSVNLSELLDKLEEEKDKFIKEFISSNDSHQELVLNDDEVKDIVAMIKDFNLSNYLSAKEKYVNIARIINNGILEEKSNARSRLRNLSEELSVENGKLDELMQEQELELEENVLEGNVKQILVERGVEFIPFYKAIDFKENLDEAVIDKLEANLFSSGLLSAKVIHDEDVDKISDINISYILPTLKKSSNLTKYFRVADDVNPFDKNYIMRILESISCDEDELIYVNENGFSFDVYKGSNISYKSKYIGYLSRKREHEKRVSEQEKVIAEIKTKISYFENMLVIYDKRLENLKQEEKDFPTNTTIIDLENKIHGIEVEQGVVLKEKTRKEEEIYNLNGVLKQLETDLSDLKGRSRIPLNLASYRDANGTIKMISDAFSCLKISVKECASKEELIKGFNEHLNDNKKNYGEIIFRISKLEEEIQTRQLEVDAIKKFTETDDFKELSVKLAKLDEIILNYNNKSSELYKQIGNVVNAIEQDEKNQADLEAEIKNTELLLEVHRVILEDEVNLGYVKDVDVDDVSGILKKLANSLKNKIDAHNNFYSGFNKYRQNLVDYNLVDCVIFNDNDSMINIYVEKGLDRDALEELFGDAERLDIVANYESKKVNLYSLLAALKSDYESNQIYLNERDNHLFHDILLKSIGTKIKDRINSALKWISDINDIMKEKQRNSNLSFYLSWVSKSPETLDEMDTRELVEIFKMDPDSLNQSVTDKLIKHFKSKIAKREETMIDNKETYYDIIFSILDYRNWYEFKLFYKKDGKDRRELTNKTFAVFSGGEKAKTMYIPLFASMSAKLCGARANAPRLIALDEAFAGVDDQNIEEMFGILKSFELDYILTSQALWCDYREISDISICELIGDKSSHAIGVKRYRWNGKVRVSLDGE